MKNLKPAIINANKLNGNYMNMYSSVYNQVVILDINSIMYPTVCRQ